MLPTHVGIYYREIRMDILKNFPITSWQETLSSSDRKDMIHALEDGQVLFFPELSFTLTNEEEDVLLPEFVSPYSKNISFNMLTDKLSGVNKYIPHRQRKYLRAMLKRFSEQAHQFADNLFPHYKSNLIVGRTSFRPIEVKDRPSSYRKDDARLHVDAFPASPNHGMRIIRIFCNINQDGKARVWRLGEPFERVATKFLPTFKKPFPGTALLLRLLKITKRYRTLYDHYMLQLHDNMKADLKYQREAEQLEVHFPPHSTWVVQTDKVSHAAMSGQHMLEQTFYLPVAAMQDQSKSPLRILEKLLNKRLVRK